MNQIREQEELTRPLLVSVEAAALPPQPSDPQALQQPSRKPSKPDYVAQATAAASNVRAQASGYLASVAASPQVRTVSSAMTQISSGGSVLAAPKSSLPAPPAPPPSLRPSSKNRRRS